MLPVYDRIVHGSTMVYISWLMYLYVWRYVQIFKCYGSRNVCVQSVQSKAQTFRKFIIKCQLPPVLGTRLRPWLGHGWLDSFLSTRGIRWHSACDLTRDKLMWRINLSQFTCQKLPFHFIYCLVAKLLIEYIIQRVHHLHNFVRNLLFAAHLCQVFHVQCILARESTDTECLFEGSGDPWKFV